MEKRSKWPALHGRPIAYLLAFLFVCGGFIFLNDSLRGSWKNIMASSGNGDDEAMEEEEQISYALKRLVRGRSDREKLGASGFLCQADLHTEVCLSRRQVRFDSNGLTVYIPSNHSRFTWKIKPYARKEDPTAMRDVTSVKIVYGGTDLVSPCDLIHNVTAIMFSSGGFSGNSFHEMNEIVIPLFLTSRHFKSRVQFIVTDYKGWLVERYRKVLAGLSDYEVLDLSADERVHCFPGAVLGLKYHDNLALNPRENPEGHSMPEFKRFMMEVHGLKVKNVDEIEEPKLMLISRQETRKILNERSLVRLMEQVGFQVVVADEKTMLSLEHFVEVVNSCSVMVGVHGAGLTHELFMSDGAVLVQIVPLGMEWNAETYFGRPGSTMRIRHLEYRINPKESSLSKIYSQKDRVISDPDSVLAKDFQAARAVYFGKQDVKIDLVRFRKTLLKALKLIGH